MNVKVFRFDPKNDDAPYYKEYQVDINSKDHMTVMTLLEFISNEIDGSLSFYSHSACLHGICGRCAVKVNGKPCLACQKVLDGNDIVIEPLKNEVVKDLVIRN